MKHELAGGVHLIPELALCPFKAAYSAVVKASSRLCLRSVESSVL